MEQILADEDYLSQLPRDLRQHRYLAQAFTLRLLTKYVAELLRSETQSQTPPCAPSSVFRDCAGVVANCLLLHRLTLCSKAYLSDRSCDLLQTLALGHELPVDSKRLHSRFPPFSPCITCERAPMTIVETLSTKTSLLTALKTGVVLSDSAPYYGKLLSIFRRLRSIENFFLCAYFNSPPSPINISHFLIQLLVVFLERNCPSDGNYRSYGRFLLEGWAPAPSCFVFNC